MYSAQVREFSLKLPPGWSLSQKSSSLLIGRKALIDFIRRTVIACTDLAVTQQNTRIVQVA